MLNTGDCDDMNIIIFFNTNRVLMLKGSISWKENSMNWLKGIIPWKDWCQGCLCMSFALPRPLKREFFTYFFTFFLCLYQFLPFKGMSHFYQTRVNLGSRNESQLDEPWYYYYVEAQQWANVPDCVFGFHQFARSFLWIKFFWMPMLPPARRPNHQPPNNVFHHHSKPSVSGNFGHKISYFLYLRKDSEKFTLIDNNRQNGWR